MFSKFMFSHTKLKIQRRGWIFNLVQQAGKSLHLISNEIAR